MYYWQVEFVGYYPVGTLAIARARTQREAAEAVYRALPDELQRRQTADFMTNPRERVLRLRIPPNGAVVLLDGNY